MWLARVATESLFASYLETISETSLREITWPAPAALRRAGFFIREPPTSRARCVASPRFKARSLLEGYERAGLSVAAIASHSALDVFDGAKDEGLKTIAICQRGREKTYFRFKRVVDHHVVLDKFSDIVRRDVVEELRRRSAIVVPNRSMAVYVGYDAIESSLPVPVFGNRYLLRWEERSGEKNYYRLLDEAGVRRPRVFSSIEEIDVPVIVKMPHARRRVERGFFVALDSDDLKRRLSKLEEAGIVRREDLARASIEELVLGAHFNVNYFVSVARGEVELLSVDRRIQTSLDGLLRLPADVQLRVSEVLGVEMVEIGHEAATVRESALERLFEVGDRVVEAAERLEPPGILGPFTLQLAITPDLDVVVFDVALRVGGGTNVYMGLGSQYSKLYFGRPLSLGRRIALEIRECAEIGCLEEIIT
ncbi:MAG: formate--phosphoribosylaminoimidazolecarboxamide ligase family protein [Fervidicoccaceae archaeon]